MLKLGQINYSIIIVYKRKVNHLSFNVLKLGQNNYSIFNYQIIHVHNTCHFAICETCQTYTHKYHFLVISESEISSVSYIRFTQCKNVNIC